MTKQPDYGSIENRVVVASFDGALLGIYHGHSVLVEIDQSPIPYPHPGAPGRTACAVRVAQRDRMGDVRS